MKNCFDILPLISDLTVAGILRFHVTVHTLNDDTRIPVNSHDHSPC